MSQILNVITCDRVCDYCYKSLSVTPVKVYPNRKIKCGRCLASYKGEEDNGVVSMYNQIATRSFFECINKFDGCTQLLESSEVVEHEKMCLSKKYKCPICLKEMFTFLIIRHFKLNHSEYLLEKPNFQVTDLRNIEKTFLYQLESDLLFVNFRDVSDSFADGSRSFLLNFVLNLEKKDLIKNLKVDFFEKNVDILNKNIYSSGNRLVTYNVTLNITNKSKLLVMFHLNRVELKSTVLKATQNKINHSDFDSLSKTFHNQLGEYLKTLLLQKREFSFSRQHLCTRARNRLNKQTYPNPKSEITINTITFSCYYCSLIYPNLHKDNYYLIGNNGNYYMKCPCTTNNSKHLVTEEGLTSIDLKNILFSCIWRCGSVFDYNQLYTHEIQCEKQVSQKCPIESCCYYFKIYEMENHVKNKHSSVIFKSTNLRNNYYDYNNYNYNNSNMIPTSIQLNLHDSYKFTKEHIMLLWCVCVHVKFKWEQPILTISFTYEIPDIKIQAKIFDRYNTTELSTVTESGSVPLRNDIIQVNLHGIISKEKIKNKC
ncbi:unnamed protein product [Psylliodes chrysocephalus]|uniref:Uncharacterized protein n=1 Tax=Psylliodes chrysocephalus TaxID=3402493 RepID=A0A9P0CI75_9CUCU|nr:unnamed protein product [Psylliodes chrysocephala]